MPVIVLGTGRCGSSITAKVLEERFGIDMGGRAVVSAACPLGSWEENTIHTLAFRFERRQISFHEFLDAFSAHVAGKTEPWGFKAPRIAHVLPIILTLLPDSRLIWCDRDVEDCVTSALNRWRPDSEGQIRERRRLLEYWLPFLNYHRLNFNRRWTEDELEQELRPALKEQYV